MGNLPSDRFSKAGLWPVIVFALLALSACGDETTNTANTEAICGGHGHMHGDHCDCDAGYSPTADGLSCEAGQSNEHDDHDHNHSSEVSDAADLVFNPSSTTGSVGEAQDGSKVVVFEAMDGGAILRLELFAAFGAPTSPGSVAMTSAETDYATCGTCIMLRTGCVAHGDHYDCTQTFMPRAEGQVDISALGGAAGERFTGELKDIVFQQVSIGQGYTTTPVPGGEALNLSSWNFDVLLEAL